MALVLSFFGCLLLLGCGGAARTSSGSDPMPGAPEGETCGQKTPYSLPSPPQQGVISGRLVDSETGHAIAGSVSIVFDFLDSVQPGTPVLGTANTSADGTFIAWTNVGFGRYSLVGVFSATDTSGVPYRTRILLPTPQCPITLGYDIGTVQLSRGSAAQASFVATASTSGGQPALIDIWPRLSVLANGTYWNMGWAYNMAGSPVAAGPDCPQGTACQQFQTPVSADAPETAYLNGGGTQWQPANALSYTLDVKWSYDINAQKIIVNCTPNDVLFGPFTIAPVSNTNLGTAAFTGC